MKTKLSVISTVVSGALLIGGPAMAQTDLLEGWSGSASLGALFTAGNSDTSNVSGSASVTKQIDEWRHTAFGSTYSAENNDIETANRFDLGYKIDRQFNDVMYGFGRLRFDSDDYGNIDNRYSGVIGVGRNLLDDGKQSLKGELGIGMTDTKFLSLTPVLNDDPNLVDAAGFAVPVGDPVPGQESLTSLDADSGLLYGGLNYSNILNEMLTFNSVFTFEAGDENTYTTWDNSLNVSVADNISLSLGLLNRSNSDIVGPRGEKTDTATRISIVYGI